jgi:hypothetical protein
MKYTVEQLRDSHDLDLQVRELGIKEGRTLIGANGAVVKITEVTPHLDNFKGAIGGKQVSFPLRAIVNNLLNGKGEIK